MPASKFITASLGFSALAMCALLAPSAASAAPAGTGLSSLAAPDTQLVQQVQWRGRHGWHGGGRHWHGGRYYNGGYGYRRGSSGAAVAAGVIGGLALGAAIAGAASAPPPVAYAPAPAYGGGDWLAYCSSKYRSFNPATGLYLGYDGQYHPCQ